MRGNLEGVRGGEKELEGVRGSEREFGKWER